MVRPLLISIDRLPRESSICAHLLGRLGLLLSFAFAIAIFGGCTMSAPMAVMHPPRLNVSAMQRVPQPNGTHNQAGPAFPMRIAFAPIVAQPGLSKELEGALQAHLPSSSAPLEMITANALAEASPIALASTAPLTSDLTAIYAARQARADLLLIGEVLRDDLTDDSSSANDLPPELNHARSNRVSLPPAFAKRPMQVAVAWRVFDVHSGKVIGTQAISINRIEADRRYPDLEFALPAERDRVIAASARETWRAVTPYLQKEDVVIALPWLQPGAAQIRTGNAYARMGRWDLAEKEWAEAVEKHPFSNSAKLNLAIAQAAREDFYDAKKTLGTLGSLRTRRLQSETLIWIDQRHRWYHEALMLPPPKGGWAFPDSSEVKSTPAPSTAPDPEDAPWWTVIPFTKPPGWTWRQWLFQPWLL